MSEPIEVICSCGDCGKKLVSIIISATNEQRQVKGQKPLSSQFKITKCAYCGGSSFATKTLDGTTSVLSCAENVQIDLEDTEILNDGIVFVTITTEKVK